MTAWVAATDGYGGWIADCGPYTGAWPPPLLTVLPAGSASLAMQFFSAPRAFDGPQSSLYADGSSPYNNYATYPTQPGGVHLLFRWYNTGYVDQPPPSVSPESLFPVPALAALDLDVTLSAPGVLGVSYGLVATQAALTVALAAPVSLSITYTATGLASHELDLDVTLASTTTQFTVTYTALVPPPITVPVLNEPIGLQLSFSASLAFDPIDAAEPLDDPSPVDVFA